MNRGPIVFLGIFSCLAFAFWGLILVPQVELGAKQAIALPFTGEAYPIPRAGLAQQGAEVYRENGCVECHTQQVRPKGLGSDYERDWGRRRTVAQDYLRDYPVLTGYFRFGPDLANIGRRQTNELWHLAHLYNPRLIDPRSSMPRYRFLFRKHPLVARESPRTDAIVEFLGRPIEPGYQLVPSAEARALVAYLVSLRSETPLFEAPFPFVPTNGTPATATAPGQAAGTNTITNAAPTTTNAAPTTK